MSKELTEQWREGTLPQGWYYVETPCKKIKKLYCGDGESLELEDPETAGYYFYHRENGKGQVEVLAPVPDYIDCKGLIYDSIHLADARKRIDELVSKTEQLVQKIHILNEANMKLENAIGKFGEQLKEANDIIISIAVMPRFPINPELCREYLEKWGVE